MNSKEEKAAYMRKWLAQNKERVNEQRRKRYAANPEPFLASARRYLSRAESRDKKAAADHRRYLAKREEIKAKRRADHAEKVKDPAYREKLREQMRAWEAAHPEKKRAWGKQYRAANREKCNAASKRSEAKKPHQYRQRHRLRAAAIRGRGTYSEAEWAAILAAWGGRCARCRTDRRICVDHVRAIKRGGMNVAANLQPLCRRCNAHKGTRFMRFLPVA